MRRTKIVATLGPATESPEMLRRLVEAGTDVVRCNLSHGGPEDLRRRMEAVLRLRAEMPDRPLGLMLDTRGPEIRVDAFPGGGVDVAAGDRFVLYARPRPGDERGVGVNYPRLAADARPGQVILLDDGNLSMRVTDVDDVGVGCDVEVGGFLKSGKKVNLPGMDLDLPVLRDEDVRDLEQAAGLPFDFLAASFIRDASDVMRVRRALDQFGLGRVAVIAKIETQRGVAHAEEILRASDGLMVARGDLGVELPAEEVPLVQKDLIRQCVEAGKPVITATQMLESMVANNRPTRAEASDVANAIFDGSDAVMLSAETAVGRFPVDSVRTMVRIAERTEQALPFRERLARAWTGTSTVTDAISYATAVSAQNLGASAILSITETGMTARMVAKYRPRNPIIAVTGEPDVVHRLSVVWGVRPLCIPKQGTIDAMIAAAVEAGVRSGAIHQGDLVVVTAGAPTGVHGTTNMLRVQTVGEVIVQGTGVGRGAATGHVVVGVRPSDAEARFHDGDVLVVSGATPEWSALMERAGAVVSEEPGPASQAVTVGVALGIPVIVGAADATRLLRDGELVTIDGARGLCYRGRARVL